MDVTLNGRPIGPGSILSLWGDRSWEMEAGALVVAWALAIQGDQILSRIFEVLLPVKMQSLGLVNFVVGASIDQNDGSFRLIIQVFKPKNNPKVIFH
jgi:hypothetical protein